MNPDLLNILSNSNKDIDNQKLMDYLSGKLSEKEKHEVEQLVSDSNFIHDAMEGLEKISGKKDLKSYVDQLNKELHEQLQKKSRRPERRKLVEYPWIWLALILILIFCVAGYLIIRMIPR